MYMYIANSMIARVAIIRLIIAFQLSVNPTKTCISHLIDTRNQKQSYSMSCTCTCSLPVGPSALPARGSHSGPLDSGH